MHDKKRIAWKESVSSTWIVLTDLISHGFVCELHGFPSFPHLKITTTSRCHSNSLKDEEWLVLATKNFSFLVKILHSKSLRIRNKYDKTHTSYQKKKKIQPADSSYLYLPRMKGKTVSNTNKWKSISPGRDSARASLAFVQLELGWMNHLVHTFEPHPGNFQWEEVHHQWVRILHALDSCP